MKTKTYLYNFLLIFLFLSLLISPNPLLGETQNILKSTASSDQKKKPSQAKKISSKVSETKKTQKAPQGAQSSQKSLESSYYIVKKGDTLGKIAKKFGLSIEELKAINNLQTQKLSVGQKLLVTPKAEAKVREEYPTHRKEPPQENQKAQANKREVNFLIHKVSVGDTIFSLAKKYNTSVEAIKNLNGISERKLKVGMELKIPLKEDSQSLPKEDPFSSPKRGESLESVVITYTVKKGDTLKKIAQKYGISAEELEKINQLRDKNLRPGQKLYVKILAPIDTSPQRQEERNYHIVKEGETLYRISLMYNVPLEELKRINHLENNIISVGQKLKIPSTAQLPEKPFVLESPKQSFQSKEENLKEKFEKNIIVKNKILTPSMLSKEDKVALSQKFIDLSKNLADSRYRLGGEGSGYLDCSAFVKLVYEELGIKLPRSSAQQFQIGTYVEMNELIPGDLVFFRTNGNRISHVGIYLGDNRFIHISSSRKRISIDSLDDPYFKKRYAGAKRVLNGEVLEYFQDYLNKKSTKDEDLKINHTAIPEVIF